jgi:hypothetical protein
MGRWRLVFCVLAAAAVPAVALGEGPRTDLVTGGGEFALDVIQETRSGEGPGDTIAFTARQLSPGSDAADGEVQWVDRIGPTAGRSHTVFHGRVTCMRVNGNQAVILYRPMYPNAPETEMHQLYVTDNGERADDVIVRDTNADFPCLFNLPFDARSVELARGEVQIQDAE